MEHSKRKHAFLSASGSARWINCTPSAKLEDGLHRTTVYADEGTLAHEYAENRLNHALGRKSEHAYRAEIKRIEAHELYGPKMPEYVGKFTDVVVECYRDMCDKYGAQNVEILIEERLDYSYYASHGFGTGDAVIITPVEIFVIDLKYGKGVPVEVKENSQLKLYGLGAALAVDLMRPVRMVTLHVVQPRLNINDRWTITYEKLIEWAAEVVKPAADKAIKGQGLLNPGEWCRWCKVAHKCRALAEHHNELAAYDFAEPATLTDDEILEIYKKLDHFSHWVKSIKDHVFKTATKGKKWPGYKLVYGKSNRRWKDEKELIETLRKNLFTDEQILNVKLKGIGDISDLMTKDEFDEIVGPYVYKPEGKPTLTTLDDKREEIGLAGAKAAFEDDYWIKSLEDQIPF